MKPLIDYIEMYKHFGMAPVHYQAVLDHGTEWRMPVYRQQEGLSVPKECFSNAAHWVSLNGGDYCEGFVWHPELPVLIHHAWVMEEEQVVEITMKHDTKYHDDARYYGIRIPHVYQWLDDFYGVFDYSDFIKSLDKEKQDAHPTHQTDGTT